MQDSDLPYKFATIWGASATAGYLTAVIPPTATGAAASQVLGFPPITSVDPGAGGIPPDIADFNGVLQYLSAWDRWAQAGGPIYFDGTFSVAIGGYPKGAVLAQAATLGQFWISTVENNTSNPDVGGANWNTLLPFAAVNGDATQPFNVADAMALTEAVALGQFASSLTTNGYYKLPGGLIIQWGITSVPGIGGSTWTYAIPFPNRIVGVLGVNNTSGFGAVSTPIIYNVTLTDCFVDWGSSGTVAPMFTVAIGW
jgi:hypothetical protein